MITPMLMVANLAKDAKKTFKKMTEILANLAKDAKKTFKKMTEILAHGSSSESTQRELSNEYQHDRV